MSEKELKPVPSKGWAAMTSPDGLFRGHLCYVDIDRWLEIYFSREGWYRVRSEREGSSRCAKKKILIAFSSTAMRRSSGPRRRSSGGQKMNKFRQCPNCGKSPPGGIFGAGFFIIYECKKCKKLYCYHCGEKYCPDCGSTEHNTAGECWGPKKILNPMP